MLQIIVMLFLVALFWGATNPFIKKGSTGITDIKADTKVGQVIAEFLFLVKRWQYMVPFLLNQSGSVLYVMALQQGPLSMVVPITNGLTFVVTAFTSVLLGEKPAGWSTYLGIVLVIVGSLICMHEKIKLSSND